MFKKLNLISAVMVGLLLLAAPVQAGQKQTEDVLNHHLASFGGGDLAAILSDYTDDSVVILPNAVLKGKAQIQGLFEALIAEFSQPGMVFNLTTTSVSDDVAYIIWNAETAVNHYNFATDTFVIKDGKIAYQTIAFVVTPK